MSDTTLKAFPSNKREALAMLYVQSRDLTNATPEDLLDLYQDAYERIGNHSGKNAEQKAKNWML